MLFSRPTIHLHISPDSWTFSTDAKTWSADTVVYLDQASERGVVEGIGTMPVNAGSCALVRLFDESDDSLDLGPFLEAFIRHGIRQVLGGISLQPRIQVRGAGSLSKRLHGYERFLIRAALVAAGMRQDSIEFIV